MSNIIPIFANNNKTNNMCQKCYKLDKTLYPSYDRLVANGFSDAQVVQFYSFTDTTKRTELFNTVKNGIKKPFPVKTPQTTVSVKADTQMCTVSEVRRMAMEKMDQTFVIDGQEFNMNAMGWKFKFNTNKKTLGFCDRRTKTIEMSSWMIEHGTAPMSEWVDTMLHEIAHAIDEMKRGKSDHSYKWERIAKAIGCRGTRCGTAEISANKYKYKSICNNCGEEQGYARRVRGSRACGKCCKKYSGGKYDERFKLVFKQNY